MGKAVDVIEAEHASVGVLVNSAGYSLEGPVEELPVEGMRWEFGEGERACDSSMASMPT